VYQSLNNSSYLKHLFFIDDSLLFCKGNSLEWCRLQQLLYVYKKALSKKLNKGVKKKKKSIFFGRHTSQDVKEQILKNARIQATRQYDKYLGLQTLIGDP
jgi:hypothetical protein